MRRILVLLVILVLAACSPGKPDNSPTVSLEKPGSAMGSPALRALMPLGKGTVKVPGGSLAVATEKGADTFVLRGDLQDAANLMIGKDLTKAFRVVASKSGGKWVLTATPTPRKIPNRYFLYVVDGTARAVESDTHFPYVVGGGYTAQSKNGKYIVSLVYPGNAKAYGLTGRARYTVQAYVELCQNTMTVKRVVSSKALGLSEANRMRLVQEVWCNGLGMAMALARAGLTYAYYVKEAALARSVTVMGYVPSWHVFTAEEYHSLR